MDASQEFNLPEQLGKADEILGFGRDDRRVGEDVPARQEMIEIDGQLESRSGPLVGAAGVSRPQVNPGQPYETDRLRVLGVQREMLVAAGQVIGLDGAFEVVTRARQITPPEGAHAEEIPSFGLRDRILAFMVDERLAGSLHSSKRQPCSRARPRPRRIGGSTTRWSWRQRERARA